MSRRTITFPPRSQVERKQRIIAVAWLVKEKGGYASPDVANDIQQDLDKAGYSAQLPAISEALRWMAQRRYAARVVHGQRTREFVMDPDVDVPEPEFIAAARLREVAASAAPPATNGATPVLAAAPAATTVRRRPPVPGRAEQRPPWLDRLTADVLRWWQNDPAAADQWAADVMDALP